MSASSPVHCYSNVIEHYPSIFFIFFEKLDKNILENGCRWVIQIRYLESTKRRSKKKDETNAGTLHQLKLIIHCNGTLTTRDFCWNVDLEGKFESRNMVLVIIGNHFCVRRNKGGYKRERQQQQKRKRNPNQFLIAYHFFDESFASAFHWKHFGGCCVQFFFSEEIKTDKIICIEVLWWMASIQLQKKYIFNFQRF